MPHLSPSALTRSETEAILRATAAHLRDHAICSLALGTGLRLAEIVGLNVGDVFAPDGTPRSRVRIRPEIAKGGRSGDVLLPDALISKLRKLLAYKRARGEGTDPGDPLPCVAGPISFPTVRGARVAPHDDYLHTPKRRRDVGEGARAEVLIRAGEEATRVAIGDPSRRWEPFGG